MTLLAQALLLAQAQAHLGLARPHLGLARPHLGLARSHGTGPISWNWPDLMELVGFWTWISEIHDLGLRRVSHTKPVPLTNRPDLDGP